MGRRREGKFKLFPRILTGRGPSKARRRLDSPMAAVKIIRKEAY
jgi:hypothetical protein